MSASQGRGKRGEARTNTKIGQICWIFARCHSEILCGWNASTRLLPARHGPAATTYRLQWTVLGSPLCGWSRFNTCPRYLHDPDSIFVVNFILRLVFICCVPYDHFDCFMHRLLAPGLVSAIIIIVNSLVLSVHLFLHQFLLRRSLQHIRIPFIFLIMCLYRPSNP